MVEDRQGLLGKIEHVSGQLAALVHELRGLLEPKIDDDRRVGPGAGVDEPEHKGTDDESK